MKSSFRHQARVGRQPHPDRKRPNLASALSGLGQRLFVGEFQLEVLRAILVLGRQAYGIQIRNQLERRLEREVSTPQVYASLTRLSDLELITAAVDELATAGRRGRPRKVYSLKASGLRMLEAMNVLDNSMSQSGDKYASYVARMAASSFPP